MDVVLTIVLGSIGVLSIFIILIIVSADRHPGIRVVIGSLAVTALTVSVGYWTYDTYGLPRLGGCTAAGPIRVWDTSQQDQQDFSAKLSQSGCDHDVLNEDQWQQPNVRTDHS